MTRAINICVAVKDAIDAGRTVYITDATETRKVVGIEFLAANSYRKFDEQSLVVQADYGNGETKPWEVVVTWPWDELDGWAMEEVDGDLIIAPEWWLKL